VDELLAPLPDNPAISGLEIALQIDTGNMIYEEFSDVEDVMEFLTRYCSNPQEILDKIMPKKKQQ